MIDRQLFIEVLSKAVPPKTDRDKALGGLLLQLYDGIILVAQGVKQMVEGGAPPVEAQPAPTSESAAPAAPATDIPVPDPEGAPLPPDILRAMEQAKEEQQKQAQREAEAAAEAGAPPPPRAPQRKVVSPTPNGGK